MNEAIGTNTTCAAFTDKHNATLRAMGEAMRRGAFLGDWDAARAMLPAYIEADAAWRASRPAVADRVGA